MSAHLSFRTESCGAIVRAFMGNRCLATAIMRRPYSKGPLWTLSRSNGEAAGSHDSPVGVRTALRRVALAYLAETAAADQAIAAIESGLIASGAIEAAAMVPQQVQQQQANAASPVRNVVMGWADDAVTAPRFSEATNRGECHRDEACGVRLIQTGKDRFTVVYGKQVKAGLSYGEAAGEYGKAVMHALACNGMLDNRERR